MRKSENPLIGTDEQVQTELSKDQDLMDQELKESQTSDCEDFETEDPLFI